MSFIAAIHSTFIPPLCGIVAALFHYFFLVFLLAAVSTALYLLLLKIKGNLPILVLIKIPLCWGMLRSLFIFTFSSPNCFTSSPTLLYQYNVCFSCMYCVLLQLFFVTHSSVSSCTNTNCIGLHSGGPQKLHQWSNVSLRVSTMISITIHLLCMRFLQMKLGLQLYAGLDEIIYRVNM